jgi:hypothetical protein
MGAVHAQWTSDAFRQEHFEVRHARTPDKQVSQEPKAKTGILILAAWCTSQAIPGKIGIHLVQGVRGVFWRNAVP